MNDDISLIGHMSGQGEAIADKLRQVGFTTLQKIIEEKPAVLAESTGLEPNIVSKIINSAKSLGTARPAKPKEMIAERPICYNGLPTVLQANMRSRKVPL